MARHRGASFFLRAGRNPRFGVFIEPNVGNSLELGLQRQGRPRTGLPLSLTHPHTFWGWGYLTQFGTITRRDENPPAALLSTPDGTLVPAHKCQATTNLPRCLVSLRKVFKTFPGCIHASVGSVFACDLTLEGMSRP